MRNLTLPKTHPLQGIGRGVPRSKKPTLRTRLQTHLKKFNTSGLELEAVNVPSPPPWYQPPPIDLQHPTESKENTTMNHNRLIAQLRKQPVTLIVYTDESRLDDGRTGCGA